MVKPVGSIGIVATMAVSNGICGPSCKALLKESKAHVTESSASASAIIERDYQLFDFAAVVLVQSF